MIRRRSAANLAIVNQADYIANENLAAGLRFMDDVERTLKDLELMPRLGRPYPVKRFSRHLIFYFPLEDGIELLTVVHSARDIPTALEEAL